MFYGFSLIVVLFPLKYQKNLFEILICGDRLTCQQVPGQNFATAHLLPSVNCIYTVSCYLQLPTMFGAISRCSSFIICQETQEPNITAQPQGPSLRTFGGPHALKPTGSSPLYLCLK